MPASPGDVVGGSLLLLVALIPTGLALLKAVERLLGHSFHLTIPERLLIAFYAAGAFIFVIVSIPLPIYGAVLLLVVLGLGALTYALFAFWEKGRGLRAAGTFVLTPTGILLGAGCLGLLVFEVLPVWNHAFPNAWDGSVTALWMNLTLHQGTLPITLSPFASAPVIYPLATTVWMTLPVLILGWPLVQAPVLLPPLFLSLTVPAAYAWGARWGGHSPTSSRSAGLVFAAFFGLVASWPRFYTGGSYDFAFALPLFLIALGLVPGLVRIERTSVSHLVGFGLLAGVLTSLSLAAGEALIVLVLAYSIATYRKDVHALVSWLGRTAIVAGFEVAFSLRSLVAWAAYGAPGYSPATEFGNLDPRLVEGELDPFVPWKAKMSPFPGLSLELQILLVAGLVLAGWALTSRVGETREPSLLRFGSDLLVGTIAMFVLTGFLLLTALPGPVASDLRSFTNLDQTSILLFVFFEAVCAFPLVLVLIRWQEHPAGTNPPSASTRSRMSAPSAWRRPHRDMFRASVGLLAVLVIVVPLASGAWYTLANGPGYIQQNVGKTSDVTSGDVAAMEWMGSHLPSCSAVLVAPGSAGQFLTEYASVRLVLPMNPVPSNGSYAVAIANLTAGFYHNQTRSALLALGVTEVFVTGETSVSFPAILPASIDSSADFLPLTHSGDAFVFGFTPGEFQFDCST